MGHRLTIPAGTRLRMPGLWTPAYASTAAWYDAADTDTITASGGFVSQWRDKSGNDYHVDQTVVGAQPSTGVLSINGVNAIGFVTTAGGSAYDQRLMVTTNLPAFDWVAVVLQHNAPAPAFAQAVGSQTLGGGTNYTVQYRGDLDPDRWQNAYFTNGNAEANSGALAVREPQGCIVIDHLLGLTNFDFQIGADRSQNGRGWNGPIGEVICGTGILDTDTRQKAEGYLAHKWQLAGDLPVGHPYKTAGPLV